MFALQLDGKPSFTSCEEYINSLLSKGESSGGELEPSLPLLEKLVHFTATERRHVQDLQHALQTSSEAPGKDEIKLADQVDIKDLSHQLLLACCPGKRDALQVLLIHCEVDLNALLPGFADTQPLTPLSVAAILNNLPACKLLMKAGAEVNRVDGGDGRSALHWAVLAGNLTTVKSLLANGAQPHAMDSQGFTALHYGCLSGLTQITALLIKQLLSSVGVAHPLTGVSPLSMACYSGNHEVLKVLLKYAPSALVLSTDGLGMSAFHHVTWGGSGKCLKLLTSHSMWREGLAQRDTWGRTPLMTAAAKGDPVMCQLLLKKGAQLGGVDAEGRGVLHWAVLSGQVPCVESLLGWKGGSELCACQDNAGATPLHYAALKNNTAILAAILSQDIWSVQMYHSPATATRSSVTYSPLVWAAGCGHLGGVEALLESQETGNGYQALHAAASVGALAICKCLLAAKHSMVTAVCSEGLTPLHYASRFGHTECVKVLLSHGAQLDCLSTAQESSLHCAVRRGHSDTVRQLIEQGADINRPLGKDKDCSVHLAASLGHTATLTVIISAGGNVDQARQSDGHTPLYLAASQGQLGCCTVLIEHGANTSTRMESSSEGLTALDIALVNGHAGCASYLMSCHAPSGGGLHHRAAATIQAVWRYYRFKCRRDISFYWSATILQCCVRRWLSQKRAKLVRQALLKTRDRAARTIQHKWKQFIAGKRHYEATYSRLKAKLRQEQLATSLIIAKLQAQTQRVCLPSAMANIPRKRPAASILKPHPQYLLRLSSNPHSVFPPSEARPVSSRPRRPLRQHSPPTIKLPPTMHAKGHSGTPVPSLSPLLKTQESSHCIGGAKSDGTRVQLPPISTNPSVTILPSSTSSNNVQPVQDSFQSSITGPTPSAPQNPITATGKPQPMSPMGNKLPPLVNAATAAYTQPPLPNQPAVASHDPTRSYQQAAAASDDGAWPSIPTRPSPLRSQLKLTRRTSTFKATPLGYRPYPSREQQKREDTSLTEDLSKLRLVEPVTEEQETTDSFCVDNTSEAPIFDGEKGAESTNDVTAVQSEKLPTGVLDEEGQGELLNQVERFERLMKVLSLLKNAGSLEELGGSSVGAIAEIHDLKKQIKLALDEAVQLRTETAVMERRLGVDMSNSVHFSPVSS